MRVASPMSAALHASVEPALPSGVTIRSLEPTDAGRLATLMVVAYAGTVDDQGEPPSFAEAEARRTFTASTGNA